MDRYYVGFILGGASMFLGQQLVNCTRTTLNDLENDPQKLEEFYQKTRAEQKKAAEEKAKAAKDALKVFDKTEPVKITSATRPNKYASFALARV